MSSQILQEGVFFRENCLKVKVMLRDPEIPYSLHSHDFYELVVVLSGWGTHLSCTENRCIGAGSVIFVRPGVSHGYDEIDNLKLYNILLGKDLFSKELSDLSEMPGFQSFFMQEKDNISILHLNKYQLAECVGLLCRIQAESDERVFDRGSSAMAYAKTLQMIIKIARANNPRTPALVRTSIERLSPVMDCIEQNLDSPLSLDQLAAVGNMSASTLNRQFKAYTGFSPVEFHIHRRIAYACTLILKTEMSVEQLSEATGFSDANYFSRQFRTHMDMSPKQYRKLWTKPRY